MTSRTADSVWGILSTPLHAEVPLGRPAWKDNAYLAFWAAANDVFGVVHVSTSPNAAGRRARFSLSVRGRSIEVIEELDPATFTSASISFGLDETVTVDAPGLSGSIISTPLFQAADYSKHAIIPELVPGEPVNHFQQAALVEGSLTIDGQRISFTGKGFRDRTWGYREESSNLDEYIAILLVAEDWALTAMRFRSVGGVDLTEGYNLTESHSQPRVAGIEVTRDASGLMSSARVAIEDQHSLNLSRIESLGGFWVPMGWTKSGPAMSAYDEFVRIRTESGDEAVGVVEHGILRRLH